MPNILLLVWSTTPLTGAIAAVALWWRSAPPSTSSRASTPISGWKVPVILLKRFVDRSDGGAIELRAVPDHPPEAPEVDSRMLRELAARFKATDGVAAPGAAGSDAV